MTLSPNPEEFEKELIIKEARLKAIRARMIEIALSLTGTPAIRYRDPQLGMTSEGFDCSGFVSAVIAQASAEYGEPIDVPRHASEQWRTFGEPVDYARRCAGDLVYFASRRKRRLYVVGHVGLVVSNREYIHSPGKDDTQVTVETLPVDQEDLPDLMFDDIYTRSPVGIKRLSLPIGTGRWHVH